MKRLCELVKVRFSLRSLFVTVAVCAVFLGYQVAVVHERAQALRWIQKNGGTFDTYITDSVHSNGSAKPQWYYDKLSKFVQLRRVLGDRAIYYIYIQQSTLTWDDREYLARLFPEAFVIPERPQGFARYLLQKQLRK